MLLWLGFSVRILPFLFFFYKTQKEFFPEDVLFFLRLTKVEKKKPEKVLREGGQFIESLFNRISSISKKRLEVLFGSIPLTSCKEKEVEGKKRCRTLILGHFK